MTAATSRRSLLGGLAVLPALAAPAIAASGPEAAFLALAPRLVPMLDEYDRIFAIAHVYYEAWTKACNLFPGRPSTDRWRYFEHLPEYQMYLNARGPADDLEPIIEKMVKPFIDEPMVTLRGLILRHRLGKTLEYLNEDVLGDLDKLVEAQQWA